MERVYFRDKSYGYSTSNIRVNFKNGKKLEQSYDVKSLLKTFFDGYNMRPSCYDCRFRCLDRVSDFTIGNFHQIGEYSSSMDDDCGTTCAWVHTERGLQILKLIQSQIQYIYINKDASSTLDTVSKKTSVPKNREEFFDDFGNMAYIELVHKWAENDFMGRVANAVKPIINRTPLRTVIFTAIKKRKRRKFTKRVEDANKE